MSPKARDVLYKSRREKNPLLHEIIGKKNKHTESEIAKKIFDATKKRICEIKEKLRTNEQGLKLIENKLIFDFNKRKFVNNKMYGSYRFDYKKGFVFIDVVLDEKMGSGRKIDVNKFLGAEKDFEIIIRTIKDEIAKNKNGKYIENYELNTPEHVFKGRLYFSDKQDFNNKKRYAD